MDNLVNNMSLRHYSKVESAEVSHRTQGKLAKKEKNVQETLLLPIEAHAVEQ